MKRGIALVTLVLVGCTQINTEVKAHSLRVTVTTPFYQSYEELAKAGRTAVKAECHFVKKLGQKMVAPKIAEAVPPGRLPWTPKVEDVLEFAMKWLPRNSYTWSGDCSNPLGLEPRSPSP